MFVVGNRYISPEQVPVKYGGLSKDIPITTEDAVTEAIVKPAAKYTIDLPASEVYTFRIRLQISSYCKLLLITKINVHCVACGRLACFHGN